jgi:hypothetical protein
VDAQVSENGATEKRDPPAKRKRRPAKRVLLDGYETVDEVCEELGITARTARKWRQTGEGPPWANIGATILYPVAEFHRWLAKRVRNTRRGT